MQTLNLKGMWWVITDGWQTSRLMQTAVKADFQSKATNTVWPILRWPFFAHASCTCRAAAVACLCMHTVESKVQKNGQIIAKTWVKKLTMKVAVSGQSTPALQENERRLCAWARNYARSLHRLSGQSRICCYSLQSAWHNPPGSGRTGKMFIIIGSKESHAQGLLVSFPRLPALHSVCHAWFQTIFVTHDFRQFLSSMSWEDIASRH